METEEQLRKQLDILISDKKKDLVSDEVLKLSQKLDQKIIKKMKLINSYLLKRLIC